MCRARPKLAAHPPAGFGYPLGGFIPPTPGRFCFAPAALMGFALRSMFLPERYPRRFRLDEPTYRFAHRFTRRKRRAGPRGRGSWAFTRPRVPRGRRVISAPSAGSSLGLDPSKACRSRSSPNLSLGFDRRPLARFADPGLRAAQRVARPRSGRNRSHGTPWTAATAFVGFLHRYALRSFRNWPRRAMCSPCAAPRVATG